METTTTQVNPIAAAVLPLKEDAVKRAEIEATLIVEKVAAELIAAGNNTDVVAPYPSRNLPRLRFEAAYSKYALFSKLTKSRAAVRMFGEPRLADMDAEGVAKFIADSKKDAAAHYDLFVTKLVAKIGPVSTATLTGNHVWSQSYLRITKADGTVEVWKTLQIVNVSKLGKLYHQWPTRKIRPGRADVPALDTKVVTPIAVTEKHERALLRAVISSEYQDGDAREDVVDHDIWLQYVRCAKKRETLAILLEKKFVTVYDADMKAEATIAVTAAGWDFLHAK